MHFPALTLRGRHLLTLDLVVVALSFILSLALRFDAPSLQFDRYLQAYAWFLIVLIAIRLAAFMWLRLYQRVWRYASVDELIAVVTAAVGSSVFAYAILFAAIGIFSSRFAIGFPRSVAVIDTILIVTLAGSWRFAARLGGVRRHAAANRGGSRALIVGEASGAPSVIRELRANDELGLVPVALLADDLAIGQRLMGVPVVAGTSELRATILDLQIAVVLLALPSASGRVLRRLVHEVEATGARCLTVPSVAEVVAGRVTMNMLREVDVEDLLRRAPARIDLESVASAFSGRRVLITGAGGSIGSELARQLVRFRPSSLVLLGRGENSIHETLVGLSGATGIDIAPLIVDIRDRNRVFRSIASVRPDVIFHAAAHKHVPLMELFPEEAVATNVFGTKNLLDAADLSDVERFVLISTDKAVNPVSVMGATKRAAELLVQEHARRAHRRYTSVRFGNVLSSRGSVIPLFRRQLANGGPLTVTHPDMSRYFMTIPEAVQLVLQAAILAAEGDMFVLDMGEPVRIVDLASDLVALHGLQIGEDIDIEFTGVRPGEKMSEQLLFADEVAEPTPHEAVRRIRHTRDVTIDDAALASLGTVLRDGSDAAIVKALQALIPEYRPARGSAEVSPS